MKAIGRLTVRADLPEALRALGEIACNLRWSWHRPARELLREVDPAGWAAAGGDPVRLLAAQTPRRLAALAADRGFRRRLEAAAGDLHDYLTGPRWYQRQDPAARPAAVAYFSPEYGITGTLPQYSGGLGILAGDHLKAASDLGVPLVGVGLFYRHGYFRQSLAADGSQREHYPALDPELLPMTALCGPDGSPVLITLALPGGRALRARVWTARVGRVPLLLLDAGAGDTAGEERRTTDRLYGGGAEVRLRQEMLLGVGGVRAVRAYCALTGHPEPEVFHTNEGHAGFLGLERINEAAGTLDFDAALQTVRAGTVFTTHTPVPAGIDRFERDLVEAHFGDDGELPGVPAERVLALGAETWPDGDPAVFNMAAMGLRLAQRANGVSTLHGEVSRRMFAGLWPGFDPAQVPIGAITNGVHTATWTAPEAAGAGTGPPGAEDGWPAAAGALSDEELWRLRRALRERLVVDARARLRAGLRERGADPLELDWTGRALDPDVLTLGFARRVPSYKRLTLMLRDPERLTALLLDPRRPVQIVVAGKAHPDDEGGKALVRDLVRFADRPEVRHRVVFLPDYDMAMAARLLPGCDVWLNTPLRPLEACGTSGMKAVLGGGLNLSVRDGWWHECYDGGNGWAIPTAEAVDGERRDRLEADALYDLVERQVVPCFYDRDRHGLPRRWISMVRHTLVTLGPKVSADRMVRGYVERLYTPAARAHRALTPPTARELSGWKTRLHRHWPGVVVGPVTAPEGAGTHRPGHPLPLRADVALGGLEPSEVEVQAVCGPLDDDGRITEPAAVPLEPSGAAPRADHRWCYEGAVTPWRPGRFGYTVRVLPAHPLLASPAELGLVALPADPAPR